MSALLGSAHTVKLRLYAYLNVNLQVLVGLYVWACVHVCYNHYTYMSITTVYFSLSVIRFRDVTIKPTVQTHVHVYIYTWITRNSSAFNLVQCLCFKLLWSTWTISCRSKSCHSYSEARVQLCAQCLLCWDGTPTPQQTADHELSVRRLVTSHNYHYPLKQ